VERRKLLTCEKCGETSEYVARSRHSPRAPREYEWENDWRTDVRVIDPNGLGEIVYFHFCPKHAPGWTMSDWMPKEPPTPVRRNRECESKC